MIKKLTACLVGAVILLVPATALATVGVGVGTGKIEVKETLKAGGIYTLPPITVFNTGTENATYAVSLTLNESQPQLKPDPKWFSFSPQQFTLTPGQSQTVIPTFKPPLVAQPGDYFGYLEAHPDATVQQGTTTVGVAAATKLSFTLTSSNFLIGLWYRLLSLYKMFIPWSHILAILILLITIYLVLRRYLSLSIKIKKSKSGRKDKSKNNKKAANSNTAPKSGPKKIEVKSDDE